MSLSLAAARALEDGRWNGRGARALASIVGPLAARGIARPAFVPEDVALVCIGGATLGGSGKTRAAIACAHVLAAIAGTRVVLVGHGYSRRKRSGAARVVAPTDHCDDVGDEALVCARALAGANVPVVVGPTRQAAIDRALALDPSVIVIDGPLRLRGRSARRTLALLAVDAARPWGSGRLPPAGDLRAPREVLLAAADHVVPIEAAPTLVRWRGEEVSPVARLGALRLGLFTALARPGRLVHALEALGIRPAAIVSAPDHGPLTPSLQRAIRRAAVEAWLCTPKCAVHLEPFALGVPVGVLDAPVEGLLPPPLIAALHALARDAVRHD